MQTSSASQRIANKVCILSSVHDSDDIRIFYKQAVGLADDGYDVSFIVQHDREETVQGVKIIPLSKPANRFERMVKTVWRVWKKAVETDADIYHFHDPELIPVGLMLKNKGKTVIYDVHEDVPRQILSKHWIAKPLRKSIARAVEIIEHYAARRFDGIVTATAFIEKRFARFGKHVVTVNNYPLLSEFSHIDPDAPKESVFAYIGGISKERGIAEMVEAIGCTKARLAIAGPVRREADRAEAAKLKGWEQVEEKGMLNRTGIAELLSRSQAGLVVEHPLINYIDALPIKLFEYMAAGIPVIASDFPLWREIIVGGKCGFCVDPLNVAEIVKAVTWIVENPEQSAEMGRNGRHAIQEHYNWTTQLGKMLVLYHALATAGQENRTRTEGVTLAE